MLVSHIIRLREDESVTDAQEAVIKGSVNRLVPILMTALSTGLALMPVAVGFGEPGSEIQAPLAMVIVCGLFSSTALNMFCDTPLSIGSNLMRRKHLASRKTTVNRHRNQTRQALSPIAGAFVLFVGNGFKPFIIESSRIILFEGHRHLRRTLIRNGTVPMCDTTSQISAFV